MKTPIEQMLDAVAWEVVPEPHTSGDLLYATHSGVFEIGGMKMRCYRLNDGRAIFNAEDFQEFFGDLLSGPSTASVEHPEASGSDVQEPGSKTSGRAGGTP